MRIPGVGGSALTNEALASGPNRALRKREQKDQRAMQAAALGLRGVNVLGDLGTQIYGIRQRGQESTADRAQRALLQERANTARMGEAQLGAALERQKMAQDLTLGRERMRSEEGIARMRPNNDPMAELNRFKQMSQFQEANEFRPGVPLDPVALQEGEIGNRIQKNVFGEQRRLDPSFYRGLSPDAGLMRSVPGSEQRDAIIETLAALRAEGLTQEEMDAALSQLRSSGMKVPPYPGPGMNPFRSAAMGISGALRGQGPWDEGQMENQLIEQLLGSGGQPGPPSPQDEAAMQAFARRRRFNR